VGSFKEKGGMEDLGINGKKHPKRSHGSTPSASE
jgi:hypothetical protein